MHISNFFQKINKTNLILFWIIISSFIIDKIYLLNISYLPAWDQGYHLSNLFKTYNFLENFSFNNYEWWQGFWSISETYRGPLTYIFSSIFLKFFGKSYESSILSNNIFSIITILCIFNICREIGNKKAGLWGAFIFAFNPYIFDQRVEYLIDISQICFLNLNFYILFKFFKSNGNYLLSLILGITLGFLFLTKPTGIFFLVIPYIYTFYLLLKNFNLNKIISLSLFLTIFIVIIWPWVSFNWLTIITSIVNSWQWGIKYQDGLEANTLEGLIFYPKIIIKLVGPTICGSFFVIASMKILRKLKNSSLSKNITNKLGINNIFLLSLPINILIICTLMSSKDLRFILPIFPSLCIFSGLFITNLKNYNWVKSYKIFIILIILLKLILNLSLQKNIFFKSTKTSKPYWPHKEIIEIVSKFSPYSKSVIAILPDTKELNTFNLASEANMQNKNIFVRQIISNDQSYKDDLDRYNWFLLKDGEQGVMSNNSKIALSNLISSSNKFENYSSWKLPDGTQATLYKRKFINESISIINKNSVPLQLDLIFSANGITADLRGSSEILSNSNLIINARNREKKYEINISFPKILNVSNKNIEIIKKVSLKDQFKYSDSLKFDHILISNKTKKIPVKVNKVFNKEIPNKYDNGEFQINKIKELEKMGNYLMTGDFDKLFNLVGLVNQSDPDQEYLKDGENIFKYRYKYDKNDYVYLYKIAISQILQKKSIEAANTLKEIMKYEKK
ncbi:ArnT family glycosyltransferase [Prochlorococcus marinus]|uniref:ArnT family glycosyltransferase n=1 Tax=Prochlorococcus marinus TaxID=1219 RepID=UPI00094D2FEE|nr:glycosyltransferase family 39 protein [Prochlorococcus marinus]